MAVDGIYDIELNGRGLRLSPGNNQYRKTAEQTYLPPRELVSTAGEQPLSAFWWEKNTTDFSGGADQKYAESKGAEVNRFLDSSNMDVSNPGEIRPMKAMTSSLSKTGTNGLLLPALGNLWLADGTDAYYYNGSAWSGALATGVTTAVGAWADDGKYIYVSGDGGTSVRRGTTGGFSAWSTTVKAHSLAFINKVLYGTTDSNHLTKFSTAGVAEHIFFADLNASWTLNCIAEHNNQIIFGGYRGSTGSERSYVWESDGTTSGTNVLIDDLPLGFKIYGLLSYADVLWIYGGWVNTVDSKATGGLYAFSNNTLSFVTRLQETGNMGEPNPAGAPTIDTIPRVAFAFGQHLYFGMNEGSGLWRYDLKHGGASRSWSADSGTNLVTGAATYQHKTYVAYSGAGAFVEDTSYQSSGSITTSATTLGAVNKKLGRKIKLAITAANTPTGEYNANALPDASTPVWTKSGVGGSESVSNGILTTDGTLTSDLKYIITDGALSNSIGSTIEGRIKIVTGYNSSTPVAEQVALEVFDGTKGAILVVGDGGIYTVNSISQIGESYGFIPVVSTTDDYHTYRMTLKGTVVKVYMDGVLRITDTAHDLKDTGDIVFGDIGTANPGDHEEKWDYVKYWRTGAFAPGDVALGSNPFTVEVSTDVNTSYTEIAGDSTFLEYTLSDIPLWGSLFTKVTLTDSTVVLNSITVEAVPTLPSQHTWEFEADLSNPMDTIPGEDENIDSQEVYEGFETARATKKPVTYKDMDYDLATVTTEYNVIIEELERFGVETEDNEIFNKVRLKIREY